MADGGFPIATSGMTGSGIVPLSGVVPSTNVHVALANTPSTSGGPNVTRTLLPAPGPPSIGQLTPMTGPVGVTAPVYHATSAQVPHRFSGGSSGGADLFPNLASSEEGRFAMSGGASSVPLGLVQGDPLKNRGEEDHHRHTVAYYYTLGLLCLFGPLTIMAWYVGNDMDAAYWISCIGMFAAIVPVYILLQHFIQLRALKNNVPVPTYFFLCVVMCPAIYFFITGGIYYFIAKSQAFVLDVPECKGDSLELEKAYTAARGLWNACVIDEVKKNGDNPLLSYPTVQSCPNFKADKDKQGLQNWKGYDSDGTTFGAAVAPKTTWSADWDYLSSVEVNQACAGWCDVPNAPYKPRLWSAAGTPAEACQNYVAHKMLVVQHQGWVIMWVGIWVFLVSIPLFILLRGTLAQLGHP